MWRCSSASTCHRSVDVAGYELHLDTELEAIREALEDVIGKGKAHYEPAKVGAPGVWIHWLNVNPKTLGALELELELVLCAPSTDAQRVAGHLSTLWNAVIGLYGAPHGPVRPQLTGFPDSPAGRPSLVLPYRSMV